MRDVVELPSPIPSSAHGALWQRVYTISVTNLAGPPPTRPAPGKPECHPLKRQPLPTDLPALTAPSFYITGRQPLRPTAILLAIVVAVGALSSVLYALSHGGHARFTSGDTGADRSANATLGGTPAADEKDDDDPDQIDTVVLGDPADAPEPARRGDHVSTVHPTILVRLPRSGDQVGFIPNTPAGQLLYNWLAAFNQASYPALATALPNFALASATGAQMELRRQTGGFRLLSAKEVQPGILVFRLRDQTPSATEVLGTLQMRPNSSPATIASFSLRAVPPFRQGPGTAPFSPASPQMNRLSTPIPTHVGFSPSIKTQPATNAK
jgi:hypothetical protein